MINITHLRNEPKDPDGKIRYRAVVYQDDSVALSVPFPSWVLKIECQSDDGNWCGVPSGWYVRQLLEYNEIHKPAGHPHHTTRERDLGYWENILKNYPVPTRDTMVLDGGSSWHVDGMREVWKEIRDVIPVEDLIRECKAEDEWHREINIRNAKRAAEEEALRKKNAAAKDFTYLKPKNMDEDFNTDMYKTTGKYQDIPFNEDYWKDFANDLSKIIMQQNPWKALLMTLEKYTFDGKEKRREISLQSDWLNIDI